MRSGSSRDRWRRSCRPTVPAASRPNSAAPGAGRARVGYRLRRSADRGQNAGTKLRLELQQATSRIARLYDAQKMFGATYVLCAGTRAPKSPMRSLVAVALMALIAGPSVAADRDAERIVTRQVASIVPPDGAGGVAVALRIEGRSLFFNYGCADRANKRPITPDTLFNLASLRKVFEATLLAQAVLKGKLGLDDSVAKYVVDLQQGGDIRQVTLG